MKNNNTESKLRKASQEQLAEPPAFVWDNIEQEIHPTKSKRRFVIWWLGAGILTSILAIYFVMFDKDKTEPSTDHLVTSETTKDNNFSNSKETTSVNDIKKESFLKDKLTQSSFKNKSEQKINYTQTTNNKVNKKSNNTVVNLTMNPFLSNNEGYYRNTIDNVISVEINENKTNEPIQFKTPTLLEVNNTNRLELISQSIVTLGLQELNYTRPSLPIHECPKFDHKIELNPFMEFGILGGMHNLSLDQSQNTALYNLRKGSESSWYTVGLYSNFGFNISKHWHASIGAEWTMSKDKFENTSEAITKMIVTFDPTSGTAIDTSFVSGNISNKGDLTYHFIDIPINLGYSFTKNKWKYGIELSGLINIKTISEGKMYNENEGITSIEGQDNIYKNSVGLGFKSSLLLARILNDNFSLQIRPSFKTYLNAITTEGYSLPTQYRIFSVSVGLKKEF